MLFGWDRFRGWAVLRFFLGGGSAAIHPNGLAKRLGISVSTAQAYLSAYEKQGVLEKEKTANIVQYRLRETPFTLELKKAFFVFEMLPFAARFAGDNPAVTALALYGSHAKGTFDEKSDIDLIAIAQQKKMRLDALRKLEEKTGKEAKMQVFSMAEWKKMLEGGDSFAWAIAKNSVLLAGAGL